MEESQETDIQNQPPEEQSSAVISTSEAEESQQNNDDTKTEIKESETQNKEILSPREGDHEGVPIMPKSSLEAEHSSLAGTTVNFVQAVPLEPGPPDDGKSLEETGGSHTINFTEDDEELLLTLKMTDSEFRAFENPYMYSEVSLGSWREDLRGMLAHALYDERNLDIILKNILEENCFIVVYKEGTKSHRKLVELLSAVGEPYHLISSRALISTSHNRKFWEHIVSYVYPPPFVLYGTKIYKGLAELEDLLYPKIVGRPAVPTQSDTMADNEFHVVVIGGSSAGHMAAITARKYRERVALVDLPTTRVDKLARMSRKIMHGSAVLLERIRLGYKYGFTHTAECKISWPDLIQKIIDFVKRSRFQKRLELRKGGVTCFTAKAKFGEKNCLNLSHAGEVPENEKKLSNIKGQYYIISTGSRQKIPDDIIGASEYCITADTLFSQLTPPGESLIIGKSVFALECAGILSACEFKVTVVMKENWDQEQLYEEDFLKKIRKHMEMQGVRFMDSCRVLRVSPDEKNKQRRTVEGLFEDGTFYEEVFDTVIVDGERVPCTEHLGLSRAGVKVSRTRHIIVNAVDRTSRQNVYAIGGVGEGRIHTMEVGKKSGKYLVERLFDFGAKTILYGMVPMVALTPLEYGCIGITEKIAESIVKLRLLKFNEICLYESRTERVIDDIFNSENTTVKLLVMDKGRGYQKILGFHYLGRDVSETLQGVFALMQSNRFFRSFDKILSTCLSPRILQNLVLKKRFSWSNESYSPVENLSMLSAEKEISFSDKTELEHQSSQIPGTAAKEETSRSLDINGKDTNEISISKEMSNGIEDIQTFGESSSCESLNYQSDVDILKEKSEFMEMSFENEKIAESASEDETQAETNTETSSDSTDTSTHLFEGQTS